MSIVVKTINENEYIEAISLSDMLELRNVDDIKKILSSFSCERNQDVHHFLLNKSIEFEKSNWSRTYLFMHINKQGRNYLLGYVSVAEKYINIEELKLSNTKRKSFARKAVEISGGKMYKDFFVRTDWKK